MSDQTDSWVVRSCEERSAIHGIFAASYNRFSWNRYQWHTELKKSYEELGIYAKTQGNDANRRMAEMDSCVLRSLASNILLEHCHQWWTEPPASASNRIEHYHLDRSMVSQILTGESKILTWRKIEIPK